MIKKDTLEIDKNKLSLRTWIEIDKTAMQENYQTFRGLIDTSCKLMAVIKSNAYGHGIIGCGKLLEKYGADFFGVDSATEALVLREKGIKKPILILGYTLPSMISAVTKQDIRITVSNFEILENIAAQKKDIKIHLKIDTGMHRQGFLLEQLPKVIEQIKESKQIKVEGIYSHFAAAKTKVFRKVAEEQIKVFDKACNFLEKNGIHAIRHLAATSGTLNYPKAHFDMVRIGIGNFGLWPSDECKKEYKGKRIALNPILTWKTIVAEVKMAKKGEGIGYDLTEILKKDSKIAILPIGYWHGFRRQLSRIGFVLINGRRAKVLGRVCMDMFMVDVSDIKNIKVGDTVTIIGKAGRGRISIEEVARLSQTSNYEFVTTLNPLMKRFYS